MNVNKLDFFLYIKNSHLNKILYFMASLIILAPTLILLITDVTFSLYFTKISISISFVFILLGKFLAILKKEKTDRSLSIDIGVFLGILIAFIFHVL